MAPSIQNVWSSYADAWRDITREQRNKLLSLSVSDDVTFTSPDIRGASQEALAHILEEFQEACPGARFETTSLIAHNGQLLTAWILRGKDDKELLKGHSYARLNEKGQICHLAGFWQA